MFNDNNNNNTRPMKRGANKTKGVPTAIPDRYTRMEIWSTVKVGPPSVMLESLHRDTIEGKGWEEIGRLVRTKYGNRPLHIRAYGGPEKCAWYIPPTYAFADNIEGQGVAISQLETLSRENAELRTKLADYDARFADLEKKIAEGQTIDDDDGDDEAEYEDAPGSPMESAFNDFSRDLFKSLLSGVGNAITGGPPGVTPGAAPGAHVAPNIADQPPYEIADDQGDVIDVPDPLLDYFETIDYERTDWNQLLTKLKNYGGMLGIVYKGT